MSAVYSRIRLIMDNFSLQGMGVAVATPFCEDITVDYDALAQMVNRLVRKGADYLVVLGTTAETPVLAPDEYTEVKRCIAEANNGRIPLVLGLGGNCTNAIINKIKNEDLTGFSAILSVVPYYNKPSQEGIYRHFKAIAEASPLPVVLYNIPGRTGVNMSAATTLRLAHDCKNIIGIKEASGKIDQVREIVSSKPENFEVVSGDDGLTLEFIRNGAVGVISVLGNLFPHEFGKMVRSALDNDYNTATLINNKFKKLYTLLFADGNPSGVKCGLHALYGINNIVRLPLVPVGEQTALSLNQALSELKDIE